MKPARSPTPPSLPSARAASITSPNLANGDMVGHTGDLSATVEAMEHLDACLGQILEAAAEVRAVVLVTADHGNADQMFELDKAGSPRLDEQGRPVPRTAHSLSPVPYALFDPSGCWRGRPRAGSVLPPWLMSAPPCFSSAACSPPRLSPLAAAAPG